MIRVKNVTAHIIVIGTTLFPIAPLASVQADENDSGVQDMLAQGKLVTETVGAPPTESVLPLPPEEAEGTSVDYGKMTMEQLRRLLTERGIAFAAHAKKPELIALLNEPPTTSGEVRNTEQPEVPID